MGIIYSSNPLIRKISEPVESFDGNLRDFIRKMFKKMYEKEGIGLAAIQLGKPIKLLVIDIGEGKPSEKGRDFKTFGKYCMINPEAIWKSKEESFDEEGCLSIPGIRVKVPRSNSVEVKYFDENGEKKTIKADKSLAGCIQHEMDHLEGILLTDYLSKIKRDRLLKKSRKLEEALKKDSP